MTGYLRSSHGDIHKVCYHLKRNAIYSDRIFTTFWNNVLLPFSESKDKSSKQGTSSWALKMETVCYTETLVNLDQNIYLFMVYLITPSIILSGFRGLWLKTESGLVNWFVDHPYTRLGATSNYSAIADLHTLQITTASAKSFSILLCLHPPFPGNGF
jgi:hypothetical protein